MSNKAPVHIVKQVWERIAPLQLAERAWDNVGIIMEAPGPNHRHRQVLLTIDLTTAVCNEALALPSCSVVVSYHPPIFRALKSMTMSDPLQASLLRLAARGISVFSPHTSLDATPKGINKWLLKPFTPYISTSGPITPSDPVEGFEGAGQGGQATFDRALPLTEAISLVKSHLGLSHLQVASPNPQKNIESIAVCAGSGGSVLRGVSADLLLTGEMSHHEVLAAIAKGQTVILCNHTNTERPFLSQVLRGWLESELNSFDPGWEVIVSSEDHDPLQII
ncbi:YbgI/family dinuclear metal center protein [Tremella mesenterica]|uniref:YbgI/family dinuclear metal center protein n=1 Tax=Tremella mesenterica TaxID=5217 RepID=A0A4Q1BTL4_TREME|nr:YbgI/family dinuclear metal center protein [Tremella mesenterica]